MGFMRLVHKWFSLLVGLQLLLWMVSGLAFAWLEHDAVTAHDSLRQPDAPVLDGAVAVLEPADLLAQRGGPPPVDVTLLPLATEWVYRVRSAEGVELRRASDGEPFAITEPLVRALASSRYAGSGSLRQVVLRQPPVLEARDAGAVWEAAYDDPARTALYFSASDGAFIAARNDTWRLFDVFWMLHTMDFDGRDDFNNPLVILFGTGALWVALTGALLLLQVFGVNAKLKSGLGSIRRTGRD